ncbi:glycosyl hydrolase family 18 protein [Streptomyces catenulae]|uniref:Glycosyl hydrolase family 18 protein n=1 Tax=Streptomyces catenulae TaxID=66875 RepID=A0ABV2YSZ3_9ACTN|nr:glycosyl hydrolase family 18 protein [Streptomyces catenulae]
MHRPSSFLARTGTALLLAAAALAGPLAAASPATTAHTRHDPTRTASAWLPYWGDVDAAYRDALRHADQLHTVSPFWYEATGDSTVTAHPGAGRRDIVQGLREAGIKVVPTVTETLDAKDMAGLMLDRRRRAAHVEALLRTVRGHGYDGIDLDYERMALTGDAADRARVATGYNALTADLCARLHALGKQCVVTVLPQTGDSGTAYDYRRLGKVADRFRIMGYDLHWSGGAPGPLSSRQWYDAFLRRATATVPRHKIEVAFPGYGWDWDRTAGGRATHRTWKEAEALRRSTGAAYRFDDASGTPHFRYRRDGHDHEVWYQDARGVAAHKEVLDRYRIRGTGLWALGFEDPGSWAELRAHAVRHRPVR